MKSYRMFNKKITCETLTCLFLGYGSFYHHNVNIVYFNELHVRPAHVTDGGESLISSAISNNAFVMYSKLGTSLCL